MEEKKNQFAESVEEEKPGAVKKNRRRFTAGIKSVLDGNFLTREKVIGLLPYLGFVTGLGVLLIFNSNFADKTVIEIGKTKRLNEELRYEYIVTKAKLMQISRQSELVNTLANTGLKESTVPPQKLLVEPVKK